MIVQSFGALQALTPDNGPLLAAALDRADPAYNLSQRLAYGMLYSTQPNLRIPIDFLAGNVAQLGLHAFRRVSTTDRVRLPDHPVVQWLAKPNPGMTQFRLFESLLCDLGVYKNAYWLKVRYVNELRQPTIGLVRLPPAQMFVSGGLLPTSFVWTDDKGATKTFPISEIVYFNGYNPLNPRMGLSHLDTLASIVNEDAAAAAHREFYWKNASRHEGVVERPSTAPRWTDTQKKSFREQWQMRFAGAGNAGLVAVLEDGMQFKPTAFSPKDSEYIAGGKLRREITAAEFNVPQPSIGILDHATFSNIREQHKQLYQDSLGPTLEMVVQEIERQLLPECSDTTNVYFEFNIAAKLAGSFEEQAAAIQVLVGRPVMTPNEGRGRLNLPAITDDPTADQLAPQQGGPAGAAAPPIVDDGDGPDGEDPSDTATDDAPDVPGTAGLLVTGSADLVQTAIASTRARQRVTLAKHPADDRAAVFLEQLDRWNRELVADLTPIVGADDAVRLAHAANVETFTALQQELAS